METHISVVVATYNQASYVSEALFSVLAHTYQPAEIIVVDDGSTNGTRHRREQIENRIRYIGQKNQGVAGLRNTGVASAAGDYVAFLDVDDLWEPEKLAIHVAAAQGKPPGFAGGGRLLGWISWL